MTGTPQAGAGLQGRGSGVAGPKGIVCGMPMTLLVGGTRSGKSGLAVRMAESSGLPVAFVATGEALDGEMAERIARHRAERPSRWRTVEASRDVLGALRGIDRAHFVVLDCLTLWTANRLDSDDSAILAAASDLASALGGRGGPSVVVSNEVGSGIVPADPASRRYRDLLGRVNGIFRQAADRSYLCAAGGVVPIEEPNW